MSPFTILACADRARCGDLWVGMGPISGVSGVVDELLRHLGYQPAQHPVLRLELEVAVGDSLLDVGRQLLAEHGLPVRDLPFDDPAEPR